VVLDPDVVELGRVNRYHHFVSKAFFSLVLSLLDRLSQIHEDEQHIRALVPVLWKDETCART
jgi:hypothetical protein